MVDDEPTLAELLSTALRYEGWQVDHALTGHAAVEPAKALDPDVIVLDVMLPDLSGIDVLRRVRATHPNVPVLFLTAKDAVEDRIAGPDRRWRRLRDQAVQPRGGRRAAARPAAPDGSVSSREEAVLVVGDLQMDEDSHEVTRGGEDIRLTATEFELLRYFMRNPKRVLSKAQILDRVWQYDFGGQANIVELYVSYLRRKIDKGRTPMLHTLRGVGYVLKPSV